VSVDYTIKAKPTVYRGQTFRSRLEARWAAFFDILQWEWVYEPFDLGGWSPDFAIRAPGACSKRQVVLVEIKPIMEFDRDVAQKMAQSCAREDVFDDRGELVEVEFEYELLLCGLGPTKERLGWFCDGEEAAFGQWSGSERIGFCHTVQSYCDRISGKHDGGHYGRSWTCSFVDGCGLLSGQIDQAEVGLRRRRAVGSPRCSADSKLHHERLADLVMNDSGRAGEIRANAADDMDQTRKGPAADHSGILRRCYRKTSGDWSWAR
jgi:hypothetical protein